MPAIPIARNEKLMPAASAAHANDTTAHGDRRFRHRPAVLLARCAVSKRLMVQIAAVPDEVSKENDFMICPCLLRGTGLRRRRLGKHARDCDSIAHSEIGNLAPAAIREQPVPGRRAELPSARQHDVEDWLYALRPDHLGAGRG